MIDLRTTLEMLFGNKPPVANVAVGQYDELFPESLVLGTLIIGRAGTGKTESLTRHIVANFKRYPNRPNIVLDWSGAISDSFLSQILMDPKRDELLKRIVYDELGHPEWVIPLPEFSNQYGANSEEQVQRVSSNLAKLAPELVRDAPFLAGLGIREIAPQIFRMLSAMTNEHGESWQVTEAKKIIQDIPLLRRAAAQFGTKVPEAKWFVEKRFLQLHERERELRTFALISLLGAIETRYARARIGYPRPGWTPKEAIEKGLLVLINGARLINEKPAQYYLFTQVYSLIMQEMNKRVPNNPDDKPVALVMDEVYSLLSIPGMAEEVGMLAPLYRSRKLELYVVLQSLSQLAPTLRQQIWSLGNVMCFALSSFDDAFEIAQQLFPYDPLKQKMPAQNVFQKPVLENDRSQSLMIANWLQRLPHRQVVIRRYWNEKKLDIQIRMVPKTKELPQKRVIEDLAEVKNSLLKERGVSIRDALEVVNKRKLAVPTPKKPPQL
jgi:hypothetical protein